jgi:hypothetical protein
MAIISSQGFGRPWNSSKLISQSINLTARAKQSTGVTRFADAVFIYPPRKPVLV